MKNIIIGIVIALVVVVGYGFVTGDKTDVVNPIGGSIGNEPFMATSTGETAEISAISTLKGSWGTLGSVVITGSNSGEIYLYDATTTNNTLRASVATSSITIAHFDSSPTVGNYDFNMVFNNGLVLELTGTQSTTTVTFK